jgi:predicted tellurium resistance membrane protein TerC
VFQASDFLTIALLVALEGLLSADNAMVLAVLVLGLPKDEQQKALRYGILGAFAFRTIATLLAVYLIHLAAIKIIGAAYLLYLVYGPSRRRDGEQMWTPGRVRRSASAFWATVVK